MGGQIEFDASSGVVSGRGEIDLASADEFRAAIHAALEAAPTRPVVVDLRDVTFMDSTGVKELIRPAVDGGAVVLRCPSEPVRRVLEAAGLLGTVTIEP